MYEVSQWHSPQPYGSEGGAVISFVVLSPVIWGEQTHSFQMCQDGLHYMSNRQNQCRSQNENVFFSVHTLEIESFFTLILQTPRSCDDYWSEFRHCKSLWNRFHHYYTYGTSPSCQQWKEDYNNCKEWEKHKSIEAKVQLEIMFLQTRERNTSTLHQDVCFMWNQIVDIYLFTGGPANEREEQTGRAGKVHSSVETEARPSQRLASAPEPGEASGLLKAPPVQQSLFHSGQWKVNED